jgi:hypothetical protein
VNSALDLLGLFQMGQRSFGVSRSYLRIALCALIDCLFEMFDRFFGVSGVRRYRIKTRQPARLYFTNAQRGKTCLQRPTTRRRGSEHRIVEITHLEH